MNMNDGLIVIITLNHDYDIAMCSNYTPFEIFVNDYFEMTI